MRKLTFISNIRYIVSIAIISLLFSFDSNNLFAQFGDSNLSINENVWEEYREETAKLNKKIAIHNKEVQLKLDDFEDRKQEGVIFGI